MWRGVRCSAVSFQGCTWRGQSGPATLPAVPAEEVGKQAAYAALRKAENIGQRIGSPDGIAGDRLEETGRWRHASAGQSRKK